MTEPLTIHPIGVVQKEEDQVWIAIQPQYGDGLLGLEGFSHIVVLYWCDRNDTPQQRATLQVHPRKNPRNPLTGVFATHAPVRPNPVAVTVCRLVRRQGLRLYLDAIDALDQSPVVDIKAHIPDQETKTDIRMPQWVQHGME